ncbi:alpha/beta hydrolase family protein [Paenibacillus oryzisoli]|uniref:dienelactone hydrolase family protein n=1 Tax=Paenibacillus oryzisoli TaxID=1850517 RepID=UPI003D2E1241
MWSGDQLIQAMIDEAKQARKLRRTGETRHQRKQRLQQLLRESLGTFASTENFTPVDLESEKCDGYTRERVELSAVPGVTFPAYILIPDGASSTNKLPGVIAVHGHGYGSRQICGMRSDGSPDRGEPDLYNHFAVQLVKRGLIVMAPDVIGFGERRLRSEVEENPDAPSSCYRMASQLLMLGKTLTGLRVKETLSAVDYLAQRSEVDATKLGIAGFSGGSLISYIVAALDERIRASLLIGFPNTFEGSIMAVHHCLCNYTPGILSQAELPDLMGLIAPRHLFLESGKDDPIFPAAGFMEAVHELQAIYEEEGARDHLGFDLFPGVHEVSGRHSFAWLRSVLNS